MIIVTGAAGFIGSNVIGELGDRGLGPVVAVDWLGEDERWRNLADHEIAAFVRPEDCISFMDAHRQEIRAIVHMGAISATTERNVDRLVALNINYSVRLWDWASANEVPLIYASSAATYGGIEGGFDDDESIKALRALNPLNAYGWSKKAVDLIFARRVADGKSRPPQWVGLKFFNVYGPNEYHKEEMMSVACKLHAQAMAGEKVRLFHSHRAGVAHGEQRRDFVYVKDCTRTIVDLIERPGVNGIFNVGTGEPRSFLDIAKAIRKVVNVPVDVEFIDMPVAIRDRYQYLTSANMAKLRRHGLGAGFASLDDGVADYVTNYLAFENRHR